MKVIDVVGAVMENNSAEILCALRSQHMSMPNVWEFPGGKVKHGEKPESALVREIKEELNCVIDVGVLVESTVHNHADLHINLLTYRARISDGHPIALEHAELRWVKKKNLQYLLWAEADIPTVEKLLKEANE